MTDYSTIVGERFDYILDNIEYLDNKPIVIGTVDNAIFWIISIRCESDINGVASIFEQLFSDNTEVENFISILLKLEENKLADQFKLIADILSNNSFWTNTKREISNLPTDQSKIILDILNRISDSQELWNLDEKLGKLLLKSNQDG